MAEWSLGHRQRQLGQALSCRSPWGPEAGRGRGAGCRWRAGRGAPFSLGLLVYPELAFGPP